VGDASSREVPFGTDVFDDLPGAYIEHSPSGTDVPRAFCGAHGKGDPSGDDVKVTPSGAG
jgi:hypothetical protein